MQIERTLTKGVRYALDDVYAFLGLIPEEAYHQFDIGDPQDMKHPDYDAGDSILMLETVKVYIHVRMVENGA